MLPALHPPNGKPWIRRDRWLLALLVLLAGLAIYLVVTRPRRATISPLAQELVFADWEGDMPQSVLDGFSAKYSVRVNYFTYAAQEEMLEAIRAGVTVDVLVLESRFVPLVVDEGLLRRINFRNVTNFKNISANFRGLAYDPDNEYSIPYNWGTTALVVRPDLVETPITRWADLWDPRYAGRTAIWSGQSREVIGLTLKSLGYSANSENPDELQAALERLIQLKSTVVFLDDNNPDVLANAAANGLVVAGMGYSGDVITGQELNPNIAYVYPEEGALLWGDNFVIPTNSPNPEMAEIFINFLLRPEINAQIANGNYYATPNEAAFPLIDPEILNNPVIFPPSDSLKDMEIIMPLSAQGQASYDRIWEQFLAAEPVKEP